MDLIKGNYYLYTDYNGKQRVLLYSGSNGIVNLFEVDGASNAEKTIGLMDGDLVKLKLIDYGAPPKKYKVFISDKGVIYDTRNIPELVTGKVVTVKETQEAT